MAKNYLNELKEIINDPKFGYSGDDFMFRTGFPTFDYLNGNVVVDEDGSRNVNIGIDGGKIITVIGKSGSGKSTFAIQVAANIIRKYEQGSMFILDFEQSNKEDRVRMVTGMSTEELAERVTIKRTGISTETVLEMVYQIKNLKMQYKKELMVENKEGVIDSKTGKLKKILPPTVIMIDSVPMMLPRDDMFKEEM